MEINVSVYFILFIIYAMIGWCIEIINGLIQTKKFVNRGFLIGPYCPIYGVGGILITLLLSKYYNDPIVLFFMGIAVCGILEYFDGKLPEIMKNMKDNDMLIITADHGNDPTTPSTDHSREYTPILVYGKQIKPNTNLGIRKTYADISATILDLFNLSKLENGTSFKNEILK